VYVANAGDNTVSVISTTQSPAGPSNTAITFAVDGNGKPVQNGGSTSSTSITFTVRATAGTYPIAGFQCSLDNRPFSSCGTATTNNTSTITFNNLEAGQQHTVKIRAIDTQGNVDPTPASFSWTVTQQQQQPPSNTAITSAKDGSGNPVSNSGSTSSTSITFTVRATAGSNPIAGFQCSLDNRPSFSSCGTANNGQGTITFNNLAAGQQHTIKIRAIDTQGNVDPVPASFSWTVLTHVQEIEQN
jgi:hypothetical protein